MSKITFLDNAAQGENNWMRYVATIILVWGTPIVIQILFILLLIPIGMNMDKSLAASLTNPFVFLGLIGVSYGISMLFLFICVKFIHKRRFISLINTDYRFSWRRLLKGAGIWFSLLIVGVIISLIIDPHGLKFTFNASSYGILLIISLLVFPVQASFEELFFRGYLMQWIGLRYKFPLIPLIVTSVIFASLHAFNSNNPNAIVDIVLQALIIGITLGIITLGENRLETAMGVHIANNIFVSVIANTSEGGFGDLPSIYTNVSTPDPLLDSLAITLYALVLILIVFWGRKEDVLRIFRRSSES